MRRQRCPHPGPIERLGSSKGGTTSPRPPPRAEFSRSIMQIVPCHSLVADPSASERCLFAGGREMILRRLTMCSPFFSCSLSLPSSFLFCSATRFVVEQQGNNGLWPWLTFSIVLSVCFISTGVSALNFSRGQLGGRSAIENPASPTRHSSLRTFIIRHLRSF